MSKHFVLVDERISDKCLNTLLDDGFEPIKLSKMNSLPSPIASHTDILAFKLGDTVFFSEAYFSSLSRPLSLLGNQNISLTKSSQGEKYPFDAIFNGLIMNGRLFCKADTFAPEIIEEATRLSLKIIPVKQGYPACTVLKISERAAITADAGMEKALLSQGISVLRIENGGVLLPPYEYGFIGGAGECFEDKVYFFGDVNTHPQAEKIIRFIEENGKIAVSLSDEPLSDLGGMIFI